MIDFLIDFRLVSGGVVEGDFLQPEPRFSALSQPQQGKGNRSTLPVAHQPENLGLQVPGSPRGDPLSHIFRRADEEKVASILQRPGGAAAQILRGAGLPVPGGGERGTHRAAGKVGRIGDTAGKAAGGKKTGNLPQVGAYTLHTDVQCVAPDILQGGCMGGGIQLHPGDNPAGIFGAQQEAQGAAAGAQVQPPLSPCAPAEV